MFIFIQGDLILVTIFKLFIRPEVFSNERKEVVFGFAISEDFVFSRLSTTSHKYF